MRPLVCLGSVTQMFYLLLLKMVAWFHRCELFVCFAERREDEREVAATVVVQAKVPTKNILLMFLNMVFSIRLFNINNVCVFHVSRRRRIKRRRVQVRSGEWTLFILTHKQSNQSS